MFNLNLKSKLRKDIILTFFTQFFIMVFAFAINKILSNKLDLSDYGYYSIIKKTTAVVAFVMLGGMGIALPRYLSYYKAKNDRDKEKAIIIASFFIIISICIFLFLLFLLFKSSFIKVITGTFNANLLYYVSIIFSFSICLSSFLYSYYRGNGNFIQFNISQIIIQLLLVLSCFFCNGKLLLLLILWSITTLVYTFIALIRELKYINISFVDLHSIILSKNTTQELLIYGFPRLIGDFILFSFSALPLIILNSKMGIKQTAYFSVGITLSNMITPIFSFLGMILLPYVSELFAIKKNKEIKITVKKLLLLYIILSTLLCFLVTINLNFFIKLFFSIKYLESIKISEIIIWSVLPQSIYLLLRNPLDAVSKTPYNMINLIISFAALMIFFYFSKTLTNFGVSFIISHTIMALLSIISWVVCCKKHLFFNQKN